MFRFAKPNGESFGPGYTGAVHAFDSGNDLIAILEGEHPVMFGLEDEDGDLEVDETYVRGIPGEWSDWQIVVKMKPLREIMLQQALATAYNACQMCEDIVNLKLRLVKVSDDGEDPAG